MHGIAPNAEPGTGTQVATLAEEGETFRAAGETWEVGRDYWDSRHQILYTLESVIGRSSWCDTRPPEECPPRLVFVRVDSPFRDDGRISVDPNDPSGETQERFVLREG